MQRRSSTNASQLSRHQPAPPTIPINHHPIIRPIEPVPSPTPSKRLDPIALRPWQKLWLRHFQSHAGTLPPPLVVSTMPRLIASMICGCPSCLGRRQARGFFRFWKVWGPMGPWNPAIRGLDVAVHVGGDLQPGSARCFLPLFSIDNLLDIRPFEPR